MTSTTKPSPSREVPVFRSRHAGGGLRLTSQTYASGYRYSIGDFSYGEKIYTVRVQKRIFPDGEDRPAIFKSGGKYEFSDLETAKAMCAGFDPEVLY